MNEPILMPISSSGPQCNSIKNFEGQEGKGHTRPKTDLEAWQRDHSRHPWAE